MLKISVVADYREAGSEVVQCLQARSDIALSFSQLRFGDYQTGEWLFERKTLPDLVQSIADGRLFQQANGLIRSNHSVAFILEGTVKDVPNLKMHRNAI